MLKGELSEMTFKWIAIDLNMNNYISLNFYMLQSKV